MGSLLLFLTSLGEWKSSRENRYFTCMMALLFIMLASDCISWAFPETGSYEGLAYFVISLNYIFGYAMAWFYLRYLCEYMPDRGKNLRAVLRVSDVLGAGSIALVLINPFVGIFFYFENGVYTLGSLYILANVFSGATHLAAIVLILRSGMSRKDKAVLLTYSILTLAFMVVDYIILDFVLTYVGSFMCALTQRPRKGGAGNHGVYRVSAWQHGLHHRRQAHLL